MLEVGAGSGYHAALLAHLVGPRGAVTTVDIDGELAAGARTALAAAGYGGVRVVCADGQQGAPEDAPYSLVIVTAGAADLAPAWLAQLAEDGRLVVPLLLRGLSRAIRFEPDGGCWRSRSIKACGFLGMQGEGAHAEQLIRLSGEDVMLRVDEEQSVDEEALAGALGRSGQVVWTGVSVGADEGVLPSLDMWLGCTMDTYGQLHVTREGVERGLVGWSLPGGISAVWGRDSLAHLAIRQLGLGASDAGRHEFGVRWYGPDGERLAARLAERIQSWDRRQRHGPGPVVRAHPAGTADRELAAGWVVDRRHRRFVISWPGEEVMPTAVAHS